MAAINAAKAVFPGAKVQGCLFHLAQSVGRNLNQNGLKGRYENDLQFANEIREMVAIAFLPPNEVNTCFSCNLNKMFWLKIQQNTLQIPFTGRFELEITGGAFRDVE